MIPKSSIAAIPVASLPAAPTPREQAHGTEPSEPTASTPPGPAELRCPACLSMFGHETNCPNVLQPAAARCLGGPDHVCAYRGPSPAPSPAAPPAPLCGLAGHPRSWPDLVEQDETADEREANSERIEGHRRDAERLRAESAERLATSERLRAELAALTTLCDTLRKDLDGLRGERLDHARDWGRVEHVLDDAGIPRAGSSPWRQDDRVAFCVATMQASAQVAQQATVDVQALGACVTRLEAELRKDALEIADLRHKARLVALQVPGARA